MIKSNRFFHKFLSFLFCFILFQSVYSIQLSDSARISLLTCSPGEELYSAFGHNGIRVTDYKEGWDVVFNYGTFDDSQPGFYYNFVKGRMIYSVTSETFNDFMSEYIYEKRSVTEQQLNLSVEDKKKIFAALYINTLPENRDYQYDFFWDNCATRPRDIFEKALGGRIKYRTDSCGFEQHKTMHDMLRLYVHNRPWVDFGFDLALGLPCEVPAKPRDQTFLPDYLAKMFACATVDGQPFVSKNQTLLDFPSAEIKTPIRPIHVTIFLMLTGFLLMFFESLRKTHYYFFDFILFLIAGLLGLLFVSLWLFTTHYSVPENLNMLWLSPIHFFVAFLLLKKKKPDWLRYYFLANCVLMLILLIGWRWNPQPLNFAFAPIIILLAVRSFSIFRTVGVNS